MTCCPLGNYPHWSTPLCVRACACVCASAAKFSSGINWEWREPSKNHFHLAKYSPWLAGKTMYSFFNFFGWQYWCVRACALAHTHACKYILVTICITKLLIVCMDSSPLQNIHFHLFFGILFIFFLEFSKYCLIFPSCSYYNIHTCRVDPPCIHRRG